MRLLGFGSRLEFYAKPVLLLIDEVGCLPLKGGPVPILFHLSNARYEQGSLVLTSNTAFGDWVQVFGHVVMIEALPGWVLHHVVVINSFSVSYRLREPASDSSPSTPQKRRGRWPLAGRMVKRGKTPLRSHPSQ